MAKAKAKQAEAEETTDDVELEDLEADVESDEAPKKKGGEEVEFGASDLAAYLTEKTGKKITPRELRALIRKMAREDTPRVDREIKAGNRSRYNWPGGLKNPEVKAIIKAVTGGELEADKQAKLAELKEKKAKKKAAEAKAGKGGKGKGKGKKEAEVEEVDLDDDDE